MNKLKFARSLLIAVSCATRPVLAHEPGAHVHGVAKLEIAIDSATLTLNLESPLDNLLGFEHLPTNAREKLAVREMADRLNHPATLFVPTLAAQCKSVSTKLASPVLALARVTDSDGHADLDGEFVFQCAHPQRIHDVEVRLFDAFPNMRQIDVQLISSHGQTAIRLLPTQRRVVW